MKEKETISLQQVRIFIDQALRNNDIGRVVATDLRKTLRGGSDEVLEHLLILLTYLLTADREFADLLDDALLFAISLIENALTFFFGIATDVLAIGLRL